MKRLFIIGNGFDLHHKLKTSYGDFKEYLSEANRETFRALEMFNLNGEQLWSCFEESLADLDDEMVFENFQHLLVSCGSDDWSESYNHDFQYEIGKLISNIGPGLISEFTEWVNSIEIETKPYEDINRLFSKYEESEYLTFNYTTTLQSIYGVENNRVLHVHNSVLDENKELILGHAIQESESIFYGDNDDFRLTEAAKDIKNYYRVTHKCTRSVIEQNESFFNSPISYDEIIVLGHSLSDVDMPYFEEIYKNRCTQNTKWKVSYYKDSEKNSFKEKIRRSGVIDDRIYPFRMTQIDKIN